MAYRNDNNESYRPIFFIEGYSLNVCELEASMDERHTFQCSGFSRY